MNRNHASLLLSAFRDTLNFHLTSSLSTLHNLTLSSVYPSIPPPLLIAP